MKRLPSFRTLLVVPICLSIVGCHGGPEGPDAIKQVHSVRIGNPEKPAKGDVYMDKTSVALNSTALAFGLAGALVFGGAAAINTSTGVKKWSGVTRPNEEVVKHAITNSIKSELKRVRGWASTDSAMADAEFRFDNQIHYGVVHIDNQRFAVRIGFAGRLLLTKDGDTRWEDRIMGTASSTGTLAEYQSNPRLFAQGAQEAASQIAAKIVAEIEEKD